MPILAYPSLPGLPVYYDPSLVALSFAIAWFASFTALDIGGRINATQGSTKGIWLVCGAVAMGGGIFSMHFIGMLAATIDLPINYAADLTILSLAYAVGFTGFGMFLVSRAPTRPIVLAASGFLTGTGVAAMHYTGMAALQVSAAISYDPTLFTTSIVIAVVAATAALWLAFNLKAAWQKALAAVIMAIAVCGMHYTAMAAATFTKASSSPAAGMTLSPALLAIAVALGALLIIGLFLISTVIDRRMSAMAQREADALKESEARLRTVSEALPISIILSPLDGGRSIYANQQAYDLFQAPTDSSERVPIRERFADRAAWIEFSIAVRETGNVENFETQMRRYDGTEFWAMISAHRITYQDQDLMVSGYHDITDRKAAEMRLIESDEKLRETNNMLTSALRESEEHGKKLETALRRVRESDQATRAKSAFLAMMSHEIRTPMNGIIGFLELLGESELLDDQRTTVDTIRQSAFSLLRVIDDVLDFSKIEAGHLDIEDTVFDLCGVVESVAEIVAPHAWSKNLSLFADCDPAVPARVIGDPARIRQVLNNLAGNAVKFTEAGKVVIRVEHLSQSGSRAKLRISVTDTGIGIPETAQQDLFEPFTQAEKSTTRRFGGTGLGLTISRRLVDLMGGRMAFESSYGSGSQFWFDLELTVASSKGQSIERFPDIQGIQAVVCAADQEKAQVISKYLSTCGIDNWCTTELAMAEELYQQHGKANEKMTIAVFDRGVLTSDLHQAVTAFFDAAGDSQGRAVVISRDRAGYSLPPGSRPTNLVMLPQPVKARALADAMLTAAGRASPTLQRQSATDDALPVKKPAPTKAEAIALGTLVLVAEDHPTNRQVIARQLDRLGYACDVVENGALALERLATGEYGILLTDCHMPELDGFELTGCVRGGTHGVNPDLPIVAITANALLGEAERCLAVGMNDYLAKPASLKDMSAVLKRWVAQPEIAAPASESDAQPRPAAEPGDANGPQSQIAIDLGVLEELVGDDPEAIRDLLASFLANLVENHDELSAARDLGIEEMDHAAHKFAGAARTAGAVSLSLSLDKLRAALAAKASAEIDGLLADVTTSVNHTRTAIKNEIGDNP